MIADENSIILLNMYVHGVLSLLVSGLPPSHWGMVNWKAGSGYAGKFHVLANLLFYVPSSVHVHVYFLVYYMYITCTLHIVPDMYRT